MSSSINAQLNSDYSTATSWYDQEKKPLEQSLMWPKQVLTDFQHRKTMKALLTLAGAVALPIYMYRGRFGFMQPMDYLKAYAYSVPGAFVGITVGTSYDAKNHVTGAKKAVVLPM
jgi:hypothetical protein